MGGAYQDDNIHPHFTGMRKLISANASTEKLTEAARRTGMHTLRENAVQYVLDGVTSVEEMLRASYE